MTTRMTLSFPDEVADFLKQQGARQASTVATRAVRAVMLRDGLERSAAVREEAGIAVGPADLLESEDETLARWAQVAGR